MEQNSIVRFGDFTLDGAQRRLLRADEDIYLPPKTFELLLYLVRNSGRVIPKDELLAALWPDVNVVENTLAQRIREIREALGDGAQSARFIKTVPRVGYQFIGVLEDEPRNAPAPPLISASTQRAGGIRIGYLVLFGAGLLTLVVALLITLSQRRTSRIALSDHQLVSGLAGSPRFPSLSPDGSTLAFVDDVGGRAQVWVRSVTDGPATQITFLDQAGLEWTRWSPSGDEIYFNYAGGIWSVPVVGGRPRNVVARGKNPSLSADGRTLAYEGLGGADSDLGIWIANADGTNSRRVINRPFISASTPAISPDGTLIVFYQSSGGPMGDLWIVPSSGGTPRRLTFDDTEGGTPSWTPDGRFVVFSSNRTGSHTLWRIRVEGGDAEPMTSGAGEDREPHVSSDGRRLIYTNVRNSFSLELLDVSTGRTTSLANRRTTIAGPRFSPQGDRITFFHETGAGTHLWTFDVNGNDLRQITDGKGERHILPRWSAKGDALFFRQILPDDSFRRVSALGGGSTEAGPWPWNSWAELDPSDRAVVYNRPSESAPRVEVPAAPGGLPVADSGVTIVRQLESGVETTLARALIKPRWSPNGKTIFGTEQVRVADRNSWNVVSCDSTSGTCRTVTTGGNVVPSPDGRSLYFMRPAARGMRQLCTTDVDGKNERCLGEIGPFRLPDLDFDVSRDHLIVWPAFHQGTREIWMARITQAN
jgi:Tol biopolymer transport system component/DNA-binding winged helix-turn-helix (wHTH) protein